MFIHLDRPYLGREICSRVARPVRRVQLVPVLAPCCGDSPLPGNLVTCVYSPKPCYSRFRLKLSGKGGVNGTVTDETRVVKTMSYSNPGELRERLQVIREHQ